MADLERLSTRRVQNAVDRSEAMKWRRTVAGGAPFAAGTPHARASRASSPEINGTSSDATADVMADIEKQLTRRVQNAVDRPGATKWRRSVAGRAPFATKDPPRESQSRELTGDIATPSDVTADGRYRKMVHETRSERRRSLRTDEMAPNDTQVGTLSTAPFWGGAQNRPNTLIFLRGGRLVACCGPSCCQSHWCR